MAGIGLVDRQARSLSMVPGRRAGGSLEPSGRVWPNGEFTLGYAPCGGLEAEHSIAEWLEEVVTPIGLSTVPNSHTDKDCYVPKRGTGGLTSHGKRMLRNSVEKMQAHYGKRNLAFVTLTLPSVTFEQAWMVSSDWARVVRVFFQKLGRYMERLGLPKTYAACTEMQTKRMNRESHPALHLHFVVVTRRRGEKGWAITPGEFRWLWASVVGPLMGNIEHWGAVENVEQVRKDASSYMSKYMSKGSGEVSGLNSYGTGWSLPTSWYSVSKRLREWVNRRIRTDCDLIASVETAAVDGECSEWFEYLASGTIDGCPGPGPHWFVGRLKEEVYLAMTEIWRESKGLRT